LLQLKGGPQFSSQFVSVVQYDLMTKKELWWNLNPPEVPMNRRSHAEKKAYKRWLRREKRRAEKDREEEEARERARTLAAIKAEAPFVFLMPAPKKEQEVGPAAEWKLEPKEEPEAGLEASSPPPNKKHKVEVVPVPKIEGFVKDTDPVVVYENGVPVIVFP
jgi:hypothetical protein